MNQRDITKMITADAVIAQGDDEAARLDQLESMQHEAHEALIEARNQLDALSMLLTRIKGQQTMSATLHNLGNKSLRTLSPMAVRSRLKGELADDPAALQRWKDYSDGARDVEATYETANYRGFTRGQRASNQVR